MYEKFEELVYNLRKVLKEENIKIKETLDKYTTFKVGGPCDIMVFPETEEEFSKVIKEANIYEIPYFILGLGSNLIVREGGIRGIVINMIKFNKITVNGKIITAQAGAKLCDVSQFAYSNSLYGFEFACGIPGTIGGAVSMNAGAYGGEMSQVIESIKVIDVLGNIVELKKHEIDFGYRKTIIFRKKYVVISCKISLELGEKNKIKTSIDDLTNRRVSKQPLEYPSAGSIFKRPEGYYTGKLIEDCGLRGYIHKNVMVSDKHCGFIVSRGNTNAKEILELIDIIRNKVYDKFGVELELEVKIVGEDKREN